MELSHQSGLKTSILRDHQFGFVVASILSFFATILLIVSLILLNSSIRIFEYTYLIPWIIIVFVVISVPVIYLVIHETFELFHPLIYAAWSYFFPAFVLGALFIGIGTNDPWYMGYIRDPERDLPLTLFYVTLGFVGLILGYAIPVGKKLGQVILYRLPSWDWDISLVYKPALLMVIAGEAFKLAAFRLGSFGYQLAEETSMFGATLNMLGMLSTMGSFLLWLAIFRTKYPGIQHYLLILFLLALSVYTMILGGGRGGLYNYVMILIGAFVFSGRRIKLRHILLLGLVVTGALLAGMAYGTLFRQIKGNEAQMSFREYFDVGTETFRQLGRQGLTDNYSDSVNALLMRMETVSQLAVFVSNYERLQSLESSYGIADIWTMTWTAFIPRAIWKDKPVISGSRSLGLLYFNYGDSSPAMTPMIDLVRNYGPLGIIPGMAFLGLLLRTLYVALIGGNNISVGRTVGYFLLLTNISYESMYGSILPILVRVCFVFIFGIIIVQLLNYKARWRTS